MGKVLANHRRVEKGNLTRVMLALMGSAGVRALACGSPGFIYTATVVFSIYSPIHPPQLATSIYHCDYQ